ncbi:cyclophilin type peptidyl-prolyl cis-trans isomerase/CLD family protein [Asticcacaulis biprosthecium C19]|uniref:peptidylprolyl isomerase n=1 Tax=Asticcacaulis biprosthecium C19 TaxID=715226 RepID=F4QR87_9CAUL|nr:peptidylprolyl isomerase [Asticcacaulis biprosthecium]EGF90724.1 cyclophilin type peptidyl-prolyl cis-trans isomerase/CLD family protein [Asticcacaulis biprosthecium C19]
MSVLKKALLVGAAAFAALAGMAGAQTLEPGYRNLDAENTLVIDTTKGRVIVEMLPQLAPGHVERMKTLTRQKFYDGLIFHRVMEDFMAQTGDPQGTGQGGSEMPDLTAEFTTRRDASFPLVVAAKPVGSQVGFVGAMPVKSQVNELMAMTADAKVNAWGLFCQGSLGMARDSQPNSANSQFFLMRGASSFLETRYTAFGTVISGLDVVRKLKIGEPPVNPDKMLTVRLLADIPEAERPQIIVMDTNSPQFKTVLDGVLKEKGDGFSVCDVTVPIKDLAPPPAAPVASN